MPEATIILPTTGDRGATLALAVASVLNQTIEDFELFIIGDGANPETCQVAREFESRDPRVKFFEFPKGNRRSEHRRDEVLAQASGRIVCYQIDRDLWFPDHLAEMSRLLQDADFAHTLTVRTAPEGKFDLFFKTDLSLSPCRQRFARERIGLPLAMGAHTLEAYRRLPEGWATTPPGWFTDSYFWAKFAGHPEMRANSSARLTIINCPRNLHPGWPTPRRLADLLIWVERMNSPDGVNKIRLRLAEEMGQERALTSVRLQSPLLFWGMPLNRQGIFEAREVVAHWTKHRRERMPKSLTGRLLHIIVMKILRPIRSWRQDRARDLIVKPGSD